MKKIGLAIILGLMFLPLSVWGWSYGDFVSCNAMNPMPTVTLKTSYGKLVHDFNYSRAELTAKFPNEEGLTLAGVAPVSFQNRIWVKQVQVIKIDRNTTCILPTEIEVFVGYIKPEVYVNKEYSFDSCNFSHAIRHEQVHQRINVLVLQHFLPLIFEELKLAVRDVKAVKVADPSQMQQGVNKLYEHYKQRLNPVLDMLADVRKVEQSRLDNFTNYRKEWDVCRKYNEEHPNPVAAEKEQEE